MVSLAQPVTVLLLTVEEMTKPQGQLLFRLQPLPGQYPFLAPSKQILSQSEAVPVP
jgi:hypothetical protein